MKVGATAYGPFRRILLAAAGKAMELGRAEDGVALVMTLATFMFMYVMCMGVYAVGTAVKDRIQLQNAADAAAYSAAVVQADTLSRIATINKAMAWTYVQMTRRQMDYIVHSWLRRICEVYEADKAKALDWNLKSICLPGNCDRVHCGGGPRADTYWCGIDEGRIGQVWANGLSPDFDEVPFIGNVVEAARSVPGMDEVGMGRAVDISEIQSRMRAFETIYLKSTIPVSGDYMVAADSDLRRQIRLDKANIAAMNVAEAELVYALKGRIEQVVPDILKANLPDGDAGNVAYRIEQADSPFLYFRYLNNTKEDELLFCSFAGYKGEPFEIFRGEEAFTPQRVAADSVNTATHAVLEELGERGKVNVVDGTDRWFVRGNGSRRAKDSDFGIQRSYKHWPEDVVSEFLYNSKYAKITIGSKSFFLPPSNLNFNGDDNSPSSILEYSSVMRNAGRRKSYGLPSIGLYAQWQWYSMMWFCYPVYIPFPPWVYWVHKSVAPPITPCSHNSWQLTITGGNDCIYLPGKVVGIWWPSYWLKVKHGIPHTKTAWHQTANGSFTDFGIPGFRGYTRVYGDDDAIYNEACYVGEKCMPMLISPLYFGELGTITVGVARKVENAWTRFADYSAKVKRGIFEAFEPAVKWSWAFSSAKAGYRPPPSSGKNAWNPNSSEYKALSNPDLPNYKNAYVVDWRGFSMDDNNWNLCQTDWDAVFVPVAKAKSWALWSQWFDTDSLDSKYSGFGPYANPSSPSYFMDKSFMNNWMLASNEWKPLKEGGSRLPAKAWTDIAAPPGMNGDFKGEKKSGSLDWESLPSAMDH